MRRTKKPIEETKPETEKPQIELDESLFEYRDHLVLAAQKAQEDYDKAVMTLSGGALGVSFAFLKDIAGPVNLLNETLVFLAWISWGLSVGAVLYSYFFSQKALQNAIDQVDRGKGRESSPGGRHAAITSFLNIAGGVLFVLGVILMAWFVKSNLGAIDVRREKPAATISSTRHIRSRTSGTTRSGRRIWVQPTQSSSAEITPITSKEVARNMQCQVPKLSIHLSRQVILQII